MIEIIPNWHPIVVHFTIALLSMSVLFYLMQALLSEQHRWQPSLSTLSKVNLWIGTAFAIITAIAGWFAYNSVAHDTPSHTAMTEHRNIALVTLAVFIVLTLWSLFINRQKKAPIFFVIAMLIAGGLLATTGWKGAEAVYRYGLGVMSLPQSSGEGHAHKHAEGEGHDDTNTMQSEKANDVTPQSIQQPVNNQEKTNSSVAPPKKNSIEEIKPKQESQSSHDHTPHTH